MTKRLSLTFLLILGLPILTMVTLGLKLAQDEQMVLESRYQELIKSELRLHTKDVENFVSDLEKGIEAVLQTTADDHVSFRKISRKTGWIETVFKIHSSGVMVFPFAESEDVSQRERLFLERTKSIVESGSLRCRTEAEGGNFSSIKTTRIHEDRGRWNTYFWNSGEHFIYCRKRADSAVLGVELHRTRLLSELVAALPEAIEFDHIVAVLNPKGEPFYHWGGAIKEGEKLNVQATVPLPAPFERWKMAYVQAGATAPVAPIRSIWFNALSGIFLSIGAVLVLSFFFYREHKRELTEAAQRVSFVNRVSHELKTPLTNIRMYAELLERSLGDEDEKLRSYVDVITSESQRLSRLIMNVLTFGKQDRELSKVAPVEHDLQEVITEVVNQCRPMLEQVGIKTEVNLETAGDALVDRDALQQILVNLISNVEKYAKDGKVMSLSAQRDGEFVSIRVEDKGPGISKADSKRIFKAFERGSDKTADGVSGTGIGLTIARDLAELHGGSLVVEESAVGTVFCLRIHAPLVESSS